MTNYLYIFIIIFYSLINQGNAQNDYLIASDYNCAKSLFPKVVTSYNVIANATGFEEYCDSGATGKKFTIGCLNGQVNSIIIYQETNVVLGSSDFACFSSIKSISIYFTVADVPELLSYSYQSLNIQFYLSFSSGTGITQFGKVDSSISSLYIYLIQQTTPLLIKFSSLLNLTYFTIGNTYTTLFTDQSHLITFENDLVATDQWKPISTQFISKNFPNLNFVSGSVFIRLIPGFDKTSLLDNVITCSYATALQIDAPTNEKVPFPTKLNLVNNNVIFSFSSTITFEQPNQIIDISNFKAKHLNFNRVGRDFHLSGNFPLLLNSNIISLSYTDGYLSELDFSRFKRLLSLKTLSLSNNSITGSIGVWDSSLTITDLNLASNNLVGQIDQSYCRVGLTVEKNLLYGELPSCFSCFLNSHFSDISQKRSLNFANNSFTTNLQDPPKCTSITINSINKISQSQYLIKGNDLGYGFSPNVGDINIYDSSNNQIQFSSIGNEIPNYQLLFALTRPLDSSSRYLTLEYTVQNQNFTVSWNPLNPQIDKVTWDSSNVLIFEGSYFAYNVSSISITLIDSFNSSTKCILNSSSFHQINCTISNGAPNYSVGISNIITIVKVANLITQITLNPYQVNYIKACDAKSQNYCNYATNQGYCNSEFGKCECFSTWQTPDCSIPFKQCPIGSNSQVCSGLGSCKNTTGICTCYNVDIIHNDCHQLECVDPLCSGHGKCDLNYGTCKCVKDGDFDWVGQNCSISRHYISSITPSLTEGGPATFYGWFSDTHDGLSIFIGDRNCTPITHISNSSIVCVAPPGEGIKSVNLTQNSISFYKDNLYKYESTIKTCPNCGEHGRCNTQSGFCVCDDKWSGKSCSLHSYNGTETNVNSTTGETTINGSEIEFELSILYLLELSIDGSVVSNYTLKKEWKATQSNDTNLYKFNQTLLDQDSAIVIYTIEQVKNDKNFTFADIEYLVKANSIKISIEISNYNYQNNLNTLQLVLESAANIIDLNDKCQDNTVNITTNGEGQDLVSILNIQVNGKTLYGRFLNYMISNNRITAITSNILSIDKQSIQIGINMAHCGSSGSNSSCLLDPDFSFLLDSSFKSSKCNNSRDWVIAVAVVIPIVGVACIIIIILIIYKKNTTLKVLIKGTKLKKLVK